MKWMMFIKHLQTLPLAEAGRSIKQLGFEGVDLTVRAKGSIEPQDVRAKLPEAIKTFADVGLKVPLLTTGITSTRDPHAGAIFESAAAHDVREIKLGYVPYKQFGTFEATMNDVARDLAGIESLAHSTGVRANLHIHSGTDVTALAPVVWHLIRDRDPSAIGAYVDPGHMVVEGSRDGWRQGLDLLHKRISLLAVKDLSWEQVDGVDEKLGKKRWRTRIVPLAQGAVPWPEVFACLKQAKFDGWVSVHSEYQGGHSWRDLSVPELIEQTGKDLTYLCAVLPEFNVPQPAQP